MLLWLPAYADRELDYDHVSIELIAIANDVGTIIGSIVLGKASDMMYKKRSPIAFAGLITGGVLFLLVAFLSDSSKYLIYTLIFLIGFVVGGVFNIVSATAAADLAKGDQLVGNSKALSTVTGILDGCGSLGAAFGSLIIGEIRNYSWNGVFIFLSAVVFLSSVPIFRVMLKEVREIKAIIRQDTKINKLNEEKIEANATK
jgi:OPA family glycerol-3-phosphate transporter-like MFS transporter 3